MARRGALSHFSGRRHQLRPQVRSLSVMARCIHRGQGQPRGYGASWTKDLSRCATRSQPMTPQDKTKNKQFIGSLEILRHSARRAHHPVFPFSSVPMPPSSGTRPRQHLRSGGGHVRAPCFAVIHMDPQCHILRHSPSLPPSRSFSTESARWVLLAEAPVHSRDIVGKGRVCRSAHVHLARVGAAWARDSLDARATSPYASHPFVEVSWLDKD